MKASYLKFLALAAGLLLSCSLNAAEDAQKNVSPADQQKPSDIIPTTSIRQRSTGQLLGWTDDPTADNVCHGYYSAQRIEFPKNLPADDTIVHSQSGTYYTDRPSILHDVEVLQPGRKLTARNAYSEVDQHDWEANDLHLLGDVHLYEPGMLIIADKGQLNIKKDTAQLETVIYRISPIYISTLNHAPPTNENMESSEDLDQSTNLTTHDKADNTKASDDPDEITTLTARGEADKVNQQKPRIINLYGATYSTCPPDSSAWHFKASRITLDQTTGQGTAINARLYVQNTPLFYLPYFNFPIDNERKSGFLYPNFGNSPTDGFHLSLPYYWNLAPNYDLTFTPTYYTRRGFKLDNVFRYLSWTRLGQLSWSILPEDMVFKNFQNTAIASGTYVSQPGYQRLVDDSTTRNYLSWQDQYIIDKNWNSLININYVSDDYYFQDFGTTLNSLLQNQMLQMSSANYDSQHWHLSGLVQNYETLHPVNNAAIIPDQYTQFPRIDFNASYPQDNLDYQLNGELVNFRFPFMTHDYQVNLPDITGQRYNLDPSVSFPLYGASYHFVPTVQYDLTAYQLTDYTPGTNSSYNRELPIVNVDSGLYFQRSFSAFGNQYYQTLEPRFYYLYVPYKDQNQLPLFDTSSQTFSYDSLFQDNRFTSIDRIGDTNQLSYGLTSRLINRSTGLDRFNASLGQIIYFEDRQVTLPNSSNLVVSNTDRSSPIVGQLSVQLLQHVYATANGAWETSPYSLNNAIFSLQYILDSQHVFSIGYNFLRGGDPLPNTTNPNAPQNNLNQIQVAEAWKFNQQWGLYSSINYNISHEYAQTYLYGVSYDSCCWAVRFVGTRSFIGLNPNNSPNYDSGIALQFTLKGMGNIGTGGQTNGLLTSSIPGYVDAFGQDKFPTQQSYAA